MITVVIFAFAVLCIFQNSLAGVATFSLVVFYLCMCSSNALVKEAIWTPIYVSRITKDTDDLAIRKIVISDFLYDLSLVSFTSSVCILVGIIIFHSNLPDNLLIWLKLLPYTWSFFFAGALFLLPSLTAYLRYLLGSINDARPRNRINSARTICCASCKRIMKRYSLEINDFLTNIELAENQAGLTECSINTTLCPKCDFPLTRETVGLKIISLDKSKFDFEHSLGELTFKSKSCLCSHCYQFSYSKESWRELLYSPPVRAQRLGESGYVISSSYCRFCGLYSRVHHQITLSDVEWAIKRIRILNSEEYHWSNHDISRDIYGATNIYYDLKNEVIDIVQCCLSGEDYFSRNYKIIDSSSALINIKFLSVDDLEKAIKLITDCIREEAIKEWLRKKRHEEEARSPGSEY